MLTAPPPRGPRGSSPSVRGRGRGGIQKRRAGPGRVDRDGDLVMDPTITGEKSRAGKGPVRVGPRDRGTLSGRSSGATERTKQGVLRGIGAKQANILESRIDRAYEPVRIQVAGLRNSKAASNPDGGLESLIGFLERKASGLDSKSNRKVKIKKSSILGESVFITVSRPDAESILKLDTFVFAGAPLKIRELDSVPDVKSSGDKPEVSESALAIKEKFRGILATRYNVELKLLDLSNLATDSGLIEMGAFDGNTNTSKIFPALMAVCEDLFTTRQAKRDAIVSVTLANNGFGNVTDVTSLATTFPDIKNLDLSTNNLVDLKSIDAWRNKFRGLENLVLTGNPIEAQLATLKDDILKWYPRLHTLNNIQVRSPDELAAVLAAAQAANELPIAGPDFRDVGDVGANFITQFLALYDTDRSALLSQYYDVHSIYSLAINMTAPRSTEITVPVRAWAEYTKYSRNMKKITHLPARMNRQYTGLQAIQPVWTSLPPTRHPNLQTESDKYVVDCHTVHGLPDLTGQATRGVDGLMITMHGEFEDQLPNVTEKSLRSFSRTFVLGPGGPNGPPIRVVSDLLALKAWAPLPKPTVTAPMAVPQQPATDSEQGLMEQKKAIATQLTERTGMTLDYSGLCLQQTGWDLEQAFVAFDANKSQLPADAWINGIPR